jgi:hypothetical protein
MTVLSITTIDPATAKPPSDEMMQQMQRLIAEMKEKGVLIATGGRNPSMLQFAVKRRAGSDAVTDGPFAESKEFVGGFALLNVKDREDALYWTKRFLDVAGDVTCDVKEVGVAAMANAG